MRLLADRGWVLTRPDLADRRKTIVEVTERVRAEGDRIRQLDVAEALAPLFPGCGPAELEWAIEALERLTKLAARPWNQVTEDGATGSP